MEEFPGWHRPEGQKLPEWFILFNKWMKERDIFFKCLHDYKLAKSNWDEKAANRIRACGIEYKQERLFMSKYMNKVFGLKEEYKKEHPDEFEK